MIITMILILIISILIYSSSWVTHFHNSSPLHHISAIFPNFPIFPFRVDVWRFHHPTDLACGSKAIAKALSSWWCARCRASRGEDDLFTTLRLPKNPWEKWRFYTSSPPNIMVNLQALKMKDKLWVGSHGSWWFHSFTYIYIYIMFNSTSGNDPIWLDTIFQMGWFNHQLVIFKLRTLMVILKNKPSCKLSSSMVYDSMMVVFVFV